MLIRRLGVFVAHPTAATVVVRRGKPRVQRLRRATRLLADKGGRAQHALRSRPAELADSRASGADLEAGTTDGRDVRAGRWIVRRDEANGGELATVIARGEEHAAPGRIGEHEDVVICGTIACAVEQIACVIAP